MCPFKPQSYTVLSFTLTQVLNKFLKAKILFLAIKVFTSKCAVNKCMYLLTPPKGGIIEPSAVGLDVLHENYKMSSVKNKRDKNSLLSKFLA